MRSYLYVPAANEKALKKSTSLDVDALIFDLEDSAAPDAKNEARARLAKHLSNTFKAKRVLVRVNCADTNQYEEDLQLVSQASANSQIQGVVLPKVDSPSQIAALDYRLEEMGAKVDLELWAMMETPLGILHADQLAASTPRLTGFILGLEDLGTRLGGIKVNEERSNISYAMQRVLMAARAYDMVVIDSVCIDYKDSKQMKKSAEHARELGFDGKSLIHPDQIKIADEIFGVSKSELDHAHKVIDAFEAARNEGKSVAALDGQMIEELHFEAAKELALKYRAQKEA